MNSAVLILWLVWVFFTSPVLAVERWSGELTVQYPLGMKLSKNDACKKAHLRAKLNAMTNAGCEKISQYKYRSCKSANNQTECEFFSETFNAFNGCFIDSYSIIQENPNSKTPDLGDVCEVTANVAVEGFQREHDPSFLISIDEDMETNFFDGDVFTIKATVYQPSFIYLLAWYPETDDGYYHMIYRGESTSEEALNGKILLPEIEARFPTDYPEDDVNEFLLILATKNKLNMPLKELISEFYARLDEYGRENWRIARVSYRIMRE